MGEYIKKFLSVQEAVSCPKKLHTPNVSYVIGSTNPGEVVFVSGNTGNPFVFREDGGFVYPAYPYPVHYIFWTNDSQNGLWDDRNNWTDEYGNHLTDLAELQDDLVVNISPYRSKKSANGVDFPTFDGFPEVVKINDTKIASTIYLANGATIQSSLLYEYPECYDRIVFEQSYDFETRHVITPLFGDITTMTFYKDKKPWVYTRPNCQVDSTGHYTTDNGVAGDVPVPYGSLLDVQLMNRFGKYGIEDINYYKKALPHNAMYQFQGHLPQISSEVTVQAGSYCFVPNNRLSTISVRKFLQVYGGKIYEVQEFLSDEQLITSGQIRPSDTFIYKSDIDQTIDLSNPNILDFSNHFEVVEHEQAPWTAYDYITFTAQEDNVTVQFNFTLQYNETYADYVKVFYSINDGEWSYYPVNTVLTLNQGDYVKFKGDNEVINAGYARDMHQFVTTGSVVQTGNWYSLLDSNLLRITSDYDFDEETKEQGAPNIPFTVTAIEDNTSVYFGTATSAYPVSTYVLRSSVNGETWENISLYTTISLNAGQSVQFVGDNIDKGRSNLKFYSNNDVDTSGELISIIDSNIDLTLTVPEGAFYFFFNQSYIKSAPKLSCSNLSPYCYAYMFEGSNLTSTPALPATEVPEGAYRAMFSNCYNLINISPISAQSVGKGGMAEMFLSCSSVVTAPEINVTSIDSSVSGYSNGPLYRLFEGCTSLETPPSVLPALSVKPDWCYAWMFSGCQNLKTAPYLPATEIGYLAYDKMFQGCNKLEKKLSYTSDFPLLTDNDFLNYFIGWEMWIDGEFAGIIGTNYPGNYYY